MGTWSFIAGPFCAVNLALRLGQRFDVIGVEANLAVRQEDRGELARLRQLHRAATGIPQELIYFAWREKWLHDPIITPLQGM